MREKRRVPPQLFALLCLALFSSRPVFATGACGIPGTSPCALTVESGCNEGLKKSEAAPIALRPIAAADVPYLRGLFSDDRVFPTFYWPGFQITDETMNAMLVTDFDAIAAKPGTRKWSYFAWVITSAETGEPVGFIELSRLTKKTAEKYLGSPQRNWQLWASRGVAIDPKFQGRGYATAAIQKVIHFGFERLGVDAFLTSTAYDNATMGAVVTKNGAVHLREDVPLYKGTDKGDNVYVLFSPDVPKTDSRYFFQHLDLPPVPQPDDVSCGPACGRSLLRALGIAEVPVTELAQAMLTGKITSGTPPRYVAAGLRSFGAKTILREDATLQDIEDALERKHGVLALVTEEGEPHWVAVSGANVGELRTMDPWKARTSTEPTVQTRSGFEASWHGESDREYDHLFIEVSKPE